MNKIKLLLGLFSVIILISACIGGVSVYASNPTTEDVAKYDITSSQEGINIAQDTANRWQQKGMCTTCEKTKVYKFAENDYLVAPENAQIVVEKVKTADGSIKVNPIIKTISQPIIASNTLNNNSVTAETPYWNPTPAAQQCFARDENGTGWMDHCYEIHKLEDDTDGSYDYYQWLHFCTFKGTNSLLHLHTAYLSCSKDSSSSTMYWVDWNPRSDMTKNCETTTISVSAMGVGISQQYQVCENWDMTKYDDAGHYKMQWNGDTYNRDTELAYMVLVKVPQNGWPIWDIFHGFSW